MPIFNTAGSAYAAAPKRLQDLVSECNSILAQYETNGHPDFRIEIAGKEIEITSHCFTGKQLQKLIPVFKTYKKLFIICIASLRIEGGEEDVLQLKTIDEP